jgi:hypothetical protein
MKFKSDIEVQAGLKDSSGSNGTSGQILSSTNGNVSWVTPTVNTVARDVQNQVKAGVAINKGQAVYVTGADGTNIIVGLASNTAEATSSKTLGLLNATVAANGFADVVQIGRLAGLDTSTAIVGDAVWLGTNGNLIYGLTNKPYAPAHLVFIGVVTRVNANNGEIFITVQNGFELKEIHDVDIITNVPINGDILGYDGTLWVNKTIAEWLGYTPADDANVVHKTGDETITGSKTFTTAVSINKATANTDAILFKVAGNQQGRITINNDSGFDLFTSADDSGYGIKLDASDSDGILFYAANPGMAKFIVGENYNISQQDFYTIGNIDGDNVYSDAFYSRNNSAYYLIPSGSSNLYNVTANQFIKSGGTAAQILAANGSVITAGTGISISGGTISSTVVGGVSSFNTRTGAVTLTSGDVTTALGYTPVTNARTLTINGVGYDLSADRSWTVTAVETDTLATVTARGNVANYNIALGSNAAISGGGSAKWITTDGTAAYGGGLISSVNGSAKAYYYFDNTNAVIQGAAGVGIAFQPNNTTALTINTSGNITANVDLRAPIFYDSNDTTYYGDFNSTTRQYQAISFGDSSRYSAINTTINGAGAGDKLILYGGTSNYDARLLVGADYDMLFKSQGNTSGKGSFKFYSGSTCTLALKIGADQQTAFYESPLVTKSAPVMYFTSTSSGRTGYVGIDDTYNMRVSNASGGNLYLGSGNTVIVENAFQSAIMFDYNNTAYYVDPASTSNLNSVTINSASTVYGGLSIVRSGGGSDPYGALAVSAPSGDNYAYMGFTRNGVIGMAMGIDTSNNYWIGTSGGGFSSVRTGTYMTVSNGGVVTALGDSRAPVFYDSNDTSYYADFNSTSNSAIRVRGGALHGPNPTWGAYLLVGGDGRNGYIDSTTTASVSTTNGNLHLDSASGYSTHINFYDGNDIILGGGASNEIGRVYNSGYLQMNGSVRAPIFYDSNNTGYYFDGSSTGDSIRVAGDIVAYYSDERLKDKKGNIKNALEKVLSLNGFHYTPNEKAQKLGYKYKEEVGVSAQEVEAVLPEIIKDAPIGHGYKTLDYGKLTPLLIEAIKEQQTQIEELKELVNKLINK